jgi:hypothetical protein
MTADSTHDSLPDGFAALLEACPDDEALVVAYDRDGNLDPQRPPKHASLAMLARAIPGLLDTVRAAASQRPAAAVRSVTLIEIFDCTADDADDSRVAVSTYAHLRLLSPGGRA